MTGRPRTDLGGAALVNGPGGPYKGWGIVHIGPEPGVCTVDDDGCGYCVGIPCRNPRLVPRRGGDADV